MSPSQVQRSKDRVDSWKHSKQYDIPEEPPKSDINQEESGAECAFKDVIGSDTAAIQPSTLDSSHSETSSAQTPNSTDLDNHPPACGTHEDQQQPNTGKSKNNSNHRRYSTRSQSQGHRRRPFWYKSVNVPVRCYQCERDYDLNPPTQSYFCTLCPAFVCTHCIDDGHHREHYGTLKGPASLTKIYDRYSR